MNNSAVLVAAGLIAGVGVTFGLMSGQRSTQSQVAEPQPVASLAASQQTQAQPQNVDRLETEKAVFQNVQITRYNGEPPEGVDVAGELYQVKATITNRTNELLTPSFTYNLRDGQGRKFEKAAFLIGLGDNGLRTTDGILAGQTREGVTIGVFDVLPGATGLELGVNDGMFASTKYVSPASAKPAAAPAASPAAVEVAAISPVQAQALAPSPAPQPVSFESLSPCDQLDSISRSGSSVADYLVAAARVNDLAKYEVAIGSVCPWNAEQLQVADRILNPPAPVIVSAPIVTVRQSSSSSSTGSSGWTPAPTAWNNCNGIQEAGESFSASCQAAQRLNDAGQGNAWSDAVDGRPEMIDPEFGGQPRGTRVGGQGRHSGYSGNSN